MEKKIYINMVYTLIKFYLKYIIFKNDNTEIILCTIKVNYIHDQFIIPHEA
jgi:hypothetical protein